MVGERGGYARDCSGGEGGDLDEGQKWDDGAEGGRAVRGQHQNYLHLA